MVGAAALAALKASNGPGDLQRMLAEWSSDKRHLDAVRDVLYRPMALADMAGSLFVRDVEMASRIKLGDEQPRPAFLDLPFDEAIGFFNQRFQDPERALEVIRVYRDRASEASKRTLQVIAEQMIERLNESLANGEAMDAFIARFEGNGFDAGYLDNVYRTNIGTAYGAGHVREIEAVEEHVGFVEYVSAGDERVREPKGKRTKRTENHVALDGKVWRVDDQEWKVFAPPCGFRCRCSIIVREEGDFDDEQLSRPVSLDWIDPRFRKSPTALVTEPL